MACIGLRCKVQLCEQENIVDWMRAVKLICNREEVLVK